MRILSALHEIFFLQHLIQNRKIFLLQLPYGVAGIYVENAQQALLFPPLCLLLCCTRKLLHCSVFFYHEILCVLTDLLIVYWNDSNTV